MEALRKITVRPVTMSRHACDDEEFHDEETTVIPVYTLMNEWWFRDEEDPDVQILSFRLQGDGCGEVEVAREFFSNKRVAAYESEISVRLAARGDES
jgi:hypothetical protein